MLNNLVTHLPNKDFVFKLNSTKSREIQFLKEVEKKFPNKFDTSKVSFSKTDRNIILICKKHNLEFLQNRNFVLKREGCPLCKSENQRKGADEFLFKAKEIHGDRYDYSKVIYVDRMTPVTIICRKHGPFMQTPNNHVDKKQNCKLCYYDSRRTNQQIVKNEASEELREQFINKMENKYGVGTYDYSKVIYYHSTLPVTIVCPKHGEFSATPHFLLRSKCNGCRKCHRERDDVKLEYIRKARLLHGDKYDYSKLNMNSLYVEIYCKVHKKWFTQRKVNHLQYSGCRDCYVSGFKYTQEEFISKLKNMYGDEVLKYDKVKYKNYLKPVTLTCIIHGDFEKIASEALRPSKFNTICPVCNSASTLENKIMEILNKLKITYIREYKIKDYVYSYDFYLPEFKTIIEAHGIQHYQETNFFINNLEVNKEIDEKKKALCLSSGIKYLEVNYKEEDVEAYIVNFLNKMPIYRYNEKFYTDVNYLIIDINNTTNNYEETKNYSRYKFKF